MYLRIHNQRYGQSHSEAGLDFVFWMQDKVKAMLKRALNGILLFCKGIRTPFCLFVLLIGLYVLSIGPAFWFYVNGHVTFDRIEVIYDPLFRVTKMSPTVEYCLLRYIKLWISELPLLKVDSGPPPLRSRK